MRRLLTGAAALAVTTASTFGCSESGDPTGPGPGPTPIGPDLVVHADPDLETLARNMAQTEGVWTGLPGIPDSVLAGRRVDVWFVEDLARLDSVGLGRSERWVAGVADPGARRIGLRVDGAQRDVGQLLTVYRHEAAHVALHAATGGAASRWLHEGYAQIASGTWDASQAWRLQFILLRGGEAMLNDLDRWFRPGREPETAYVLAYTAVDALRALGGDAGLAALFARLAEGETFERSLRLVYGLTAEQFESRWRDRVLDRYGWLYLLSRTAFVWLGVTVLVIVLGVARVRRDRRRLAEMREREQREEAMLAAFLRALGLRRPDGPDSHEN